MQNKRSMQKRWIARSIQLALILIILFANNLWATQVRADLPDPVNYWDFDQDSGATLDPSIGKLFGKIQGPVNWVEGKNGNALQFDGDENYVLLNAASFDPPWSAAVWVKKAKRKQGESLLYSPNYSLKFEQWRNTHQVGISKFYMDNGISGFDSTFNVQLPLNGWYHVTFVGTDSGTSLYINGEIQDHVTNVVQLPRQGMGAENNWQKAERFQGLLDDLALFDKALTADQVKILYCQDGMINAPSHCHDRTPHIQINGGSPQVMPKIGIVQNGYQHVTITNTGKGVLNIEEIVASADPDQAKDFAAKVNPPVRSISLTGGHSFSFRVMYHSVGNRASRAGPKSADVLIYSNANPSPQEIELRTTVIYQEKVPPYKRN